jgi:hypothetical protein
MISIFGYPIAIIDLISCLAVLVIFVIIKNFIKKSSASTSSSSELIEGFRNRLKSLDGKGPFSKSN